MNSAFSLRAHAVRILLHLRILSPCEAAQKPVVSGVRSIHLVANSQIADKVAGRSLSYDWCFWPNADVQSIAKMLQSQPAFQPFAA